VPTGQSQAIITVLHGGLDQSTLHRWRADLLANWPGPEPCVRTRFLEEVLADLEGAAVRSEESLFILLAQSLVSPLAVDRLVSGAAEAGLPAMIVINGAEAWRPLQRQGVLFVELGAPMVTIAAMSYALAERQAALDTLAGEARIAQRCQASIRLEMERMHEELNLAACIQREFTSAPLPQMEGVNFGLLYRPMNFVSGDIYNVHAIDEHLVSFLVADVVGHGVPAALLTMVLSNSLSTVERTAAQSGRFSPARVLQYLNERLCQSSPASGRFATAVYGILDTRRRSMVIAGAGHPPPLLLDASRVRALETQGPLLGVFPGAEFDEISADLHPGDSVYVYTDGLEQAFPRSEEATMIKGQVGGRLGLAKDLPTLRVERLLGELHRQESENIEAMMTEISLLLDMQKGSLHLADDVTVLGLGIPRLAAEMRAAA
jgi:serine phosphatase RsbU (regulator of sigma subunit)